MFLSLISPQSFLDWFLPHWALFRVFYLLMWYSIEQLFDSFFVLHIPYFPFLSISVLNYLNFPLYHATLKIKGTKGIYWCKTKISAFCLHSLSTIRGLFSHRRDTFIAFPDLPHMIYHWIALWPLFHSMYVFSFCNHLTSRAFSSLFNHHLPN